MTMRRKINAVGNQANRLGKVLKKVLRIRTGRIGLGVFLVIAAVAILAPIIAPYDPIQQDLIARLEGPSLQHPLGTDSYGRDVLSRIIFGFRISLLIGVVSVSIGAIMGVAIGVVGGYYGGKVDTVVGRLIDTMLAFPFLLFALFVVAVLGQSLINVMLAVGIATSPRFARLARGDTFSVKESKFVTSAKGIGRPNVKIMAEHIIPNIIAPIVVMASLNMGKAIIISAALSFTGLGVQPPTPTLGALLSSGQQYMETAPWITIFPGIAITITVLGFNLLGDALRDALDPQLQQGGGFT